MIFHGWYTYIALYIIISLAINFVTILILFYNSSGGLCVKMFKKSHKRNKGQKAHLFLKCIAAIFSCKLFDKSEGSKYYFYGVFDPNNAQRACVLRIATRCEACKLIAF